MEFVIDNNTRSVVKVFGVGGCGCNALGTMHRSGIYGVDFVALNTDNQSLNLCPVERKVQLGPELSRGHGSGSKPEVGKNATIESADEIKNILEQGTGMLFITAGMGKGTGTGASPEIAKMAKEMGILTVGVITTPFKFEGKTKSKNAEEGLQELKKYVDCYIIIENERVLQAYKDLPSDDAYEKANEILLTAVKGLTEIITVPIKINIDLEDAKTVMTDTGIAIVGAGVAAGENRLKDVVYEALHSPVLPDHLDIKKFSKILLNISSVRGEKAITLGEMNEIVEIISEKVGREDITYGQTFNDDLGESISLTIIATGFIEEEVNNLDISYRGDIENGKNGTKEKQPTSFSQPDRKPIFRKPVLEKKTYQDPIKIPKVSDEGYESARVRLGKNFLPFIDPIEGKPIDDGLKNDID